MQLAPTTHRQRLQRHMLLLHYVQFLQAQLGMQRALPRPLMLLLQTTPRLLLLRATRLLRLGVSVLDQRDMQRARLRQHTLQAQIIARLP